MFTVARRLFALCASGFPPALSSRRITPHCVALKPGKDGQGLNSIEYLDDADWSGVSDINEIMAGQWVSSCSPYDWVQISAPPSAKHQPGDRHGPDEWPRFLPKEWQFSVLCCHFDTYCDAI